MVITVYITYYYTECW